MELQLVNVEQAKALKELGFPTKWTYNKNIPNTFQLGDIIHGFAYHYCPALELVAKWLRDEKDICVVVTEYTGGDRDISRTYRVDIHYNVTNEYGTFRETEYIDYKNQNSKDMDNWEYFTKYEEALSAGIDKAIEILKMYNCNQL